MRGRRRLPALPGLLLVMVLVPLDQTALTPALPEIAGDLGGITLLPLIVTVYVVAVTAGLPLHGKLGDRLGRRPTLLVALALFMLGALACTVAQSLTWFMVARVLQGLGGGGLMVGAQAALGEIVSPRERGRYLGLFGAAYIIPAVIGPLIGGLLVEWASWRWIFAIHLPLGGLAMLLLWRTLVLRRPPRGVPIDVFGSLALASAVVGVAALAAVAPDPSSPRWALPSAGMLTAVALVLWVVSAGRAADPVLPPRMMRRRGVLVPMLLSFTVGFALFGTITYVPSFARIGLGMSAVHAGLVASAVMGGAILTMTLSGRLIARTGSYRPYPVAGTALILVGSLVLGRWGAGFGTVGLAVTLGTIGLGVGLVMQVMLLAAQNAADPADLGAATSGVLFLRQVGASVGAALVGALVTDRFRRAAPAGAPDPATLTPETIAALPEALRLGVERAFADAVPEAIAAVAPLLVVAVALSLLLPAVELRSRPDTDPSLEA